MRLSRVSLLTLWVITTRPSLTTEIAANIGYSDRWRSVRTSWVFCRNRYLLLLSFRIFCFVQISCLHGFQYLFCNSLARWILMSTWCQKESSWTKGENWSTSFLARSCYYFELQSVAVIHDSFSLFLILSMPRYHANLLKLWTITTHARSTIGRGVKAASKDSWKSVSWVTSPC